jgi:hypothetical protein
LGFGAAGRLRLDSEVAPTLMIGAGWWRLRSGWEVGRGEGGEARSKELKALKGT